MDGLLEKALTRQIDLTGLETVEVKVRLEQIDMVGNTFLKFEPPIVAVPNDWKSLWDLEEREKMSLRDREVFEEELIRIMHI